MKSIKNNIYSIAYLLVILLIATGCEKRISLNVDAARVNFWMLEDMNNNLGAKLYTKGFTFALLNDAATSDTFKVRVKVMGPVVSQAREFTAVADPLLTTSVENTHYKILKGVVKANEYVGYLPVVLYRTADLKTSTKSIALVLSANEEFKAGAIEESKFLITFNDALLKPDNWAALTTYFGVYSEVKYKFIIQTLGVSQFPLATNPYKEGQFTSYQMIDLKNRLRDALKTYNDTHPEPLKDESKALVTFP